MAAYLTATPLVDAGSERALLGALLAGGDGALFEVMDIVQVNDWYYAVNQTLYCVLKEMVVKTGIKTFEMPAILSTATGMGLQDFTEPKKRDYLASLVATPLSLEAVAALAATVCKLAIARRAKVCLNGVLKDINTITGGETIHAILTKIEDPIYSFTAELAAKASENLVILAEDAEEHVVLLASAPKDVVGLPSGFPGWDTAIGGGLRPGGIHVIGARPKRGKSFLCLNMAYLMATAGIPVLYLDTELTRDHQMLRLLSMMSGVELTLIESGKFTLDEDVDTMVKKTAEIASTLPITHAQIAGLSVQSVLSIVRRWLVRNVGFTELGVAKPCVVIYDYLKLMDRKDINTNMAEHQVLGFLMTEMNNFAIKHMIPIVCTCQLNRDGVEKEGSEVFAGSDRILWLCSSATILKNKSTEEFQEDPPINGQKKMVVTDTRFGTGMEAGDYVNVRIDLARAYMRTGKLRSQALAQQVPVVGQIKLVGAQDAESEPS